jgi:putative transposase
MTDMKKSKFTEEQIIGFLKQAEAGMAVAEICRKGGFSDATFYKWRAKFGGMEVSEAKRLRSWRRRTPSSSGCWPRRTWTSCAQERLRGKKLAPQAQARGGRAHDRTQHQLSERRACRLVGLSRDSYRHPPVPSAQTRR